MAQAVRLVSARIDHFLDYLLREWEAVPDYLEEFGTWDDVQQLAFVHEWDIRENGLRASGLFRAGTHDSGPAWSL